MFSKERLLSDLERLGIRPEGTVLVHSSMRAVGQVNGGAETVLDVFTQFFRPGLLIFPTHTWAQIGWKKTVYDSRTEPACVGILPNLFRKREGVIRSLHPTHSVAAMGSDAASYTEGEQYRNTPCPREGCWGKLIDRDAEILFLGCTLRSNTFIHGVEEWNHIPNRISAWTQPLTILDEEGESFQVDMHRHACIPEDLDVSENYGKLEPVFEKLGAIRRGRFGNAECIVGNARKMNEITSTLLKKDPDLFGSGEAIPTSWY